MPHRENDCAGAFAFVTRHPLTGLTGMVTINIKCLFNCKQKCSHFFHIFMSVHNVVYIGF